MSLRTTFAMLIASIAATAAHAQQFDPFVRATIVPRPGAQIPLDAPLRDSNGQATSLRKIADGRPMLLVPVLHQCPNLCGVTLDGVIRAIAGQAARPGTDFALVAFGIDPREGPPDARQDLQRLHHAEPSAPIGAIAAVTGSTESIARITNALGYRYAWDPRIGQYAHVSATAAISPDGRLSSWLYGVAPPSEALVAALAAARAEQPRSVMQQLLLLCYHFDPATGRYSLTIDRIVKAAGVATVGLMIAMLLFLGRRRRAQ